MIANINGPEIAGIILIVIAAVLLGVGIGLVRDDSKRYRKASITSVCCVVFGVVLMFPGIALLVRGINLQDKEYRGKDGECTAAEISNTLANLDDGDWGRFVTPFNIKVSCNLDGKPSAVITQ